MTENTVDIARETKRRGSIGADLRIMVCYTGAHQRDFSSWLGPDLQYAPQPSGDIGTRMEFAFKTAFNKGALASIAIGSDVPELTSKILHQALESLHSNDIVLGRAADGGYYLIGMNSLHPELFKAIDWGTSLVYEQTRDRILRLGLTLADLSPLRDVDRPEDLGPLRRDHRFMDIFTGKPLISVIIPTLDESANLGPLLDRLRRSEDVEIIVPDGDSHDNTREIAAGAGARVLKISGGRALQQNAGAATAKGQLLLFLHADTLPPDGYADMIRRALDNPATIAGAFRFKTDNSRGLMRLIEWATNLRSAVLQYPYGDQGLFIAKRAFKEMDGFSPLPIMEDFEFVRRLRRRGKIITLPVSVITSARRWQHLGVIRTTMINQLMILGFLIGIPIQTLKRIYRINGTQLRQNT